jgi:hypothetical protein
LGGCNLENLKKRHPFLNEYSDEVLQSTSLDTLLKLESTSIKLKNLENAKASEDKLSQNRDNLEETEYKVTAGIDNRWSSLHDSRFLPGMGCTVNKMWVRGREVLGSKGHAAIGTYDMAGIGLAGHVTPQGWVALHDPGHSGLSLRLFSINNCGRRVNTKVGGSDEDGLVDVEELGELKTALRVLREAMAMVHPWNKSVTALEGFLLQNNFCSSCLEGVENKAKLLNQFIDYVLRENSNRWKGQENFLSVGDLKGTWESYFGSRPQSLLVKKRTVVQASTVQSSGAAAQKSAKFIPRIMFQDDICVMWNMGRCMKAPGQCATRNGRFLRHICNHRPNPNDPARFCGLSHAACYYH